jgi:hypothetical protein
MRSLDGERKKQNDPFLVFEVGYFKVWGRYATAIDL